MRLYCTSFAVLASLASVMTAARAAEDTDTPGAGRWEINVGLSATKVGRNWEYGLPEMELNYGVGERMQLQLAGSRVSQHEADMPVRAGTGSATVGLKWRLLDQEQAGLAVAVFPQYTWNPSSSAERRGIVEPGSELLVPLLLGLRQGDTGYYAEFGRTIANGGSKEWARGVKILHQCRANVECRLELQHELASPTGHQTIISTGVKWALNDTFVVVAGIGRDVGRNREDARGVIFNLGLQILK